MENPVISAPQNSESSQPHYVDVLFVSCVLYPLLLILCGILVNLPEDAQSQTPWWTQALASFRYCLATFLPAATLTYLLPGVRRRSGRIHATRICTMVGFLVCNGIFATYVWLHTSSYFMAFCIMALGYISCLLVNALYRRMMRYALRSGE